MNKKQRNNEWNFFMVAAGWNLFCIIICSLRSLLNHIDEPLDCTLLTFSILNSQLYRGLEEDPCSQSLISMDKVLLCCLFPFFLYVLFGIVPGSNHVIGARCSPIGYLVLSLLCFVS